MTETFPAALQGRTLGSALPLVLAFPSGLLHPGSWDAGGGGWESVGVILIRHSHTG